MSDTLLEAGAMLQLPPKSSCQLPASLSKSHAPNLDHDGDGDEWENHDETSGISLTTTTAYVQNEPNKKKTFVKTIKHLWKLKLKLTRSIPDKNFNGLELGSNFSLLTLVF